MPKKSNRSAAGKNASASKRTLSDDEQRELDMLRALRTRLVAKMEQEEVEFEAQMRQFDKEEKVAFETACREYTKEQLNMTPAEFEISLQQEVVSSSSAAGSSNMTMSEVPRIRIKKNKGNKKVQTTRPRRPSIVNQYAPPLGSIGRQTATNAMKTNFKNSKPRKARMGNLLSQPTGVRLFYQNLPSPE